MLREFRCNCQQAAVAAGRPIQREPDRQARGTQSDGQRDAWNAGIAAGIGVADEGQECRHAVAVEFDRLVLPDRPRRERRRREDRRVNALASEATSEDLDQQRAMRGDGGGIGASGIRVTSSMRLIIVARTSGLAVCSTICSSVISEPMSRR